MLDNRIGMDENGTQTWTLYDGSDPVMDFNGSGSLEMRCLNGPTGDLVDSVIARESAGGTIAWYLSDRLGTIRDLINNSGSIIDHIDFSAFGTVLDESSPSNCDRMMGFAGMERDTVTGLNLAVNRVQNPGTGRWTSQDPLGLGAGDPDLYRYVENDSTNAVDISGLQQVQVPEVPPGIDPKTLKPETTDPHYEFPTERRHKEPDEPVKKGPPGTEPKWVNRNDPRSYQWYYWEASGNCPGWKLVSGKDPTRTPPPNRGTPYKWVWIGGRWIFVVPPGHGHPKKPPPRTPKNTYYPPAKPKAR
jgi:RHS repeat-associated protein